MSLWFLLTSPEQWEAKQQQPCKGHSPAMVESNIDSRISHVQLTKPPHLVRAHQKDFFNTSFLREETENVLRSLFGSKSWSEVSNWAMANLWWYRYALVIQMGQGSRTLLQIIVLWADDNEKLVRFCPGHGIITIICSSCKAHQHEGPILILTLQGYLLPFNSQRSPCVSLRQWFPPKKNMKDRCLPLLKVCRPDAHPDSLLDGYAIATSCHYPPFRHYLRTSLLDSQGIYH